MLGFIKKVFVVAITFFSFNSLNVNSLEFVSINIKNVKQEQK